MLSITGYVCIVFYFLTLCLIIIDTRTINDQDIVDDNHNRQIDIILSNYRHRFEHSMDLKKLRWTIGSHSNKAYCDFCNLVIPVVRIFRD
jgi:hypothetical protein